MKSRIICTMLIGLLAASGSISAQVSEERIQLLEQQLELLKGEIQELKAHLFKEESEGETRASVPPGSGAVERAATTITPLAEPEKDPNQFRVYWQDGVRMDSADEQFKLRIGGRIMNDWAFVGADDSLVESLGPLGTLVRDGTQFRRARLYAFGVLYDRIEYRAEFDFADRFGNFSDIYVGLRDVPVLGTLKAGHFKEPFGLEALTSSNNITLLERSAGGAFAPLRNIGIAFSEQRRERTHQLRCWSLSRGPQCGQQRRERRPKLDGPGHRTAGLRRWRSEIPSCRCRLQPPGSTSGRDSFRLPPRGQSASPLRYDSTPRNQLLQHGWPGRRPPWPAPFRWQSEYMKSSVNSVSSGDPTFSGFYVLGSFFLTGEHRPYWHGGGAFDRVRPNSSFMDDGGTGAWEIVARYSQLDLNDRLVRGGEMKNFTFGVNWHLNPYSRIMWNYVRSEVEDTGNADILQMRFKIDF